ncbi:MAG: type II secretion system F family protein [Planctomycetota bacterium]|nr:type II secretion system F family protein [Planctomycetota bacterium]
MPKYAYQGRDSRAKAISGVLEATGEEQALRQLRGDGITVTDIRIASELLDVEELRIRQASKEVKREEVISFSSQLSVMLETGVPLGEALGAFLTQSKTGGFRRVIEVVTDRINSGVSFSAAIAEFPKAFPPLMTSLLRASEATGALGTMLGRIAEYLGRERRTVKQIKGALTYPAARVVMAIVVTVFLVGWVLPRFAKIYESRAAALPMPTRILLGVSDAIMANWGWLLLGVAALIAATIIMPRTKRGRYAIDWTKLSLPIIGPIFQNFYLSRAARTLGTLLGSGVQLLDAVQIVRGVTDNALWNRFWDEMEFTLTRGGQVSDVVLHTNLMTPPIAQMITAGDRTGRLPEVLEKVADVTEQDLEESIKTGTQMIEPMVIAFMGLVIGGIAIALLLPIFSMGSVVSQ